MTRAVLAATSGSSATDLFWPATDEIDLAAVEKVLVTLEVVTTTGTSVIEAQRAYQVSNDGITWDTATAFTGDSGWVSAMGYDYAGSAETIAPTKRFARVGLLTNQKSGTDIEQMRVNVTTNLVPR